jgi:hypothetical protein
VDETPRRWTPTRAYLRLLLGGAGQGLRDNTADLSSTLRRFAPTTRDLAKITSQLKERRGNIRRTVHNFQLLANALGDKDAQLTQLVDSTDAVFRAFASEDQNIQATLAQLPPTLTDTQVTLRKLTTLGNTLGPTLQALLPGARALGPSLAATRPALRGMQQSPLCALLQPLPRCPPSGRAAYGPDLAALTRTSRPGSTSSTTRSTPGLQPARADRGLPVLALLAQPARPHHLRDAGRPRPDPARPVPDLVHLRRRAGPGGQGQPLLKTILDLLNPVQQSQVCPARRAPARASPTASAARPAQARPAHDHPSAVPTPSPCRRQLPRPAGL